MQIQEHGHSATVSLSLEVEGRSLPCSHMGPGYVRLESPAHEEFASGTQATTVVVIDGRRQEYRVSLDRGICLGERKVVFSG